VKAILPCPRTCGATQGNIAYTQTVKGKLDENCQNVKE
jgi:hypothetical protein